MNMTTGEVMARAVGAHQLVDGILYPIIVSYAIVVALPQHSGEQECLGLSQ